MATEGAFVYDETFKNTTDLSAKQYFSMKLSAADTVAICSAATDQVIGILQNNPTANQGATVRLLGRSKAVTDGSGTAIAFGDKLGTDANGRLMKKTADTDLVAGFSNGASSASGTKIDVFLTLGAQRAS